MHDIPAYRYMDIELDLLFEAALDIDECIYRTVWVPASNTFIESNIYTVQNCRHQRLSDRQDRSVTEYLEDGKLYVYQCT